MYIFGKEIHLTVYVIENILKINLNFLHLDKYQ
jgi:hypothetical protein